jgi:hypothetical protein
MILCNHNCNLESKKRKKSFSFLFLSVCSSPLSEPMDLCNDQRTTLASEDGDKLQRPVGPNKSRLYSVSFAFSVALFLGWSGEHSPLHLSINRLYISIRQTREPAQSKDRRGCKLDWPYLSQGLFNVLVRPWSTIEGDSGLFNGEGHF